MLLYFSEKEYPVYDFKKNLIDLGTCALQKNTTDQWFLTKTLELVSFEGIFKKLDEHFIRGRIISHKENDPDFPLDSSLLHTYKSNGILSSVESIFTVKDFFAKMFKIRLNETEYIFSPLKHTFSM